MSVNLEDRGKALENEYFRRKEQELIDKMRVKIGSGSARNTELKCPKCDGTLHETDYENVKIDLCDGCHGVWLDSGELAQISHKDESGWFGRLFS